MSAHDPDPQHFGFLVQGLKYQQKIALKTKSELIKKERLSKIYIIKVHQDFA